MMWSFKKRTQTLVSIVWHAASLGILLVAAMMVLKEFGVEIGPMLAAAGIVGLAVGFGYPGSGKDVINSFYKNLCNTQTVRPGL